MDGFDPLDPNNYLPNNLPIHTSNDEFNDFMPTLGNLQTNNNFNLGYGRFVAAYIASSWLFTNLTKHAKYGNVRPHNGTRSGLLDGLR